MNTFKKKSLHAAVLAGLGALGAAGTANAVHINPEGLGQVVIFPYYTVRNGNVTAISIVNTNNETKIVKVRFLEGKNSREVLDFNLFLSPSDVWTGVVIPTAAGARLETGDNSCVTPSDLFGNATGVIRTDALGLPLNDFKNYQYTGALVDNALLGSLDRTREGYMEVIEMGVVIDPVMTGFIKHSAAGVPANCAALDAYDALSTAAAPAAKLPGTLVGATRSTQYLAPPSGGLFGRESIINAANGTNYAIGAMATLDSWFNPPVPTLPPYSASGNVNPSLSSQTGIDTNSLVFVSDQPAGFGFPASAAGVVRATWASSVQAVTSVFMRSDIYNEFLTDAATVSRTDWVVTMPTKRDLIGVGAGAPNRPFSNNFASATPTGACDAYLMSIFNREEGTLTNAPGVILPSPRPPAASAPGQNLCWEANVIEFGALPLLGSTNNTRLQGAADAFASTGATTTGAAFATLSRRVLQGPNGWASLDFGNTGLATQAAQSITPISSSLNGVNDAVPRTFFGLPVIGTSFHNYTNTGVASAYGGVLAPKYVRFIR